MILFYSIYYPTYYSSFFYYGLKKVILVSQHRSKNNFEYKPFLVTSKLLKYVKFLSVNQKISKVSLTIFILYYEDEDVRSSRRGMGRW